MPARVSSAAMHGCADERLEQRIDAGGGDASGGMVVVATVEVTATAAAMAAVVEEATVAVKREPVSHIMHASATSSHLRVQSACDACTQRCCRGLVGPRLRKIARRRTRA